MRLEFPSYDPIIQSIQTFSDVDSVLRSYFQFAVSPHYLPALQMHLGTYPHRLENPAYLQLFTRVGLMAGEYAYSEMSAHKFGHEDRGHKRDYIHPAHLVALGTYMSDLNVRAGEAKRRIIEDWKEYEGANPTRELQIWGRFVRPQKGEIVWPSPRLVFKHVTPPVRFDRIEAKRLPIMVPETELHTQVRQIGISDWDADVVTRDQFATNFLPQTVRAFGSIQNIRSVFEDSREVWS